MRWMYSGLILFAMALGILDIGTDIGDHQYASTGVCEQVAE
jgi:hypothetical protein